MEMIGDDAKKYGEEARALYVTSSSQEVNENTAIAELFSTVDAVQRKARERLDSVERHPRVQALLKHCAALENQLCKLPTSSLLFVASKRLLR